jgi:hypothetical protein
LGGHTWSFNSQKPEAGSKKRFPLHNCPDPQSRIPAAITAGAGSQRGRRAPTSPACPASSSVPRE